MKKPLIVALSFALVMMLPHFSYADLDTLITGVVTETRANNKNKLDSQAIKGKVKRGYQFLPQAIVLLGNEVTLGESLGPYTVVTDPKSPSLKSATSALVKSTLTKANIVVRGAKTGQMGLADGEIFIKSNFASDREVILEQYGLELVSVTPSGNFFTARVSEISDLPSVFAAISANALVKEADLSVNYFDQVPQ
jgi:hypothetical protein